MALTIETTYPLTPLQEGMYLEASEAGRPWVYLEQILCHLTDERIDAIAMTNSWKVVLQRHRALCAVIETAPDGSLEQRIGMADDFALLHEDWSDKTDEEQNNALNALLDRERRDGVHAGKAPAMRVRLIQTSQTSAKLIWCFPHSLLDGRSFAAVLDDVFECYEMALNGTLDNAAYTQAPDLFAHHCLTLSEMDHSNGVAHFAQALQGWEGGTGLIAADAEPGRKRYIDQLLSAAQTTALNHLATEVGVPVGTLIMAAWGIVTARITGRDDVVFGNTLNGRHLIGGSKDAVGCFIVTVPLRMRLTVNLCLAEVLEKLRRDQIALRDYEQTPLTMVRAQTDVPPGVPLFDSLVMFETDTLQGQMQARGGKWANRKVDLFEEGGVPVTLAAYLGDALKCTVEYDPNLVPQGPRLAAYFSQFLVALSKATPQTPLSEISMLDDKETAEIYALSGAAHANSLPDEDCLTLFSVLCAQSPDQIALEQDGREPLSFGALDEAANALAHTLLENEIKPGDRVGICAARSPEFILAIFAIWKAGAVFVPMDPSYPQETLDILAQDSGAKIILTDQNAARLEPPTLSLSNAFENLSDVPPSLGADPDRAAYVIFTSGSTGRPKGVMVSHASFAAHARAAQERYSLTRADRCLQFASLSFDVALEEIMSTLLAGATLVLRTDEMSQSTAVFLDQCSATKLTLLNLPTGFWVALTDTLEDTQAKLAQTVRMVVVGGERVPLSVLRRWRALEPDVRWVNGYGPTEATITCTAHEVSDVDLHGTSVPIGSAFGHAANWVLCADGALAPLGTEGQLWVTGPAVAMGYAGLPEQTAERFVTAPFDPTQGRAYGTGDQAFFENGLLQFIGRVDRQIKLRGFRIEPGQIEQVLEAQTDIARAYVAIHEGNGHPQRLVAWFSDADVASPVAVSELKTRMANALPAHMRPEPVKVDHWPQTPGGKIDTKRLPPPVTQISDAANQGPETPKMREIADIFGALLKISDVSVDASFFDLGGQSLLLLRLLTQIEARFGVRLKPAALYAHPTARGVHAALEAKDLDPLVVLPIQPHGNQPPLYGVHVLGENGAFFRPLANAMGRAQPLFGLTVGLLTEDTPTNVNDLAKFYFDQITRHRPEGPISLAAVSAGSYVTLELAQQLLAAGRDVRALIFLDAQGPGGRQRIGKIARIGAHARLLSRNPFGYLAKLVGDKREAIAHFMARSRLNKQGPTGNAAVKDVNSFIAANTLAIETYEPQTYPRKITIIRAADDLFDSPQAIKQGLGWGVIAGAGFEIHEVPGDHLGILNETNAPSLAKVISQVL